LILSSGKRTKEEKEPEYGYFHGTLSMRERFVSLALRQYKSGQTSAELDNGIPGEGNSAGRPGEFGPSSTLVKPPRSSDSAENLSIPAARGQQ